MKRIFVFRDEELYKLKILSARSSVGRACVLYTHGPWFESKRADKDFNSYTRMVLGSSPSGWTFIYIFRVDSESLPSRIHRYLYRDTQRNKSRVRMCLYMFFFLCHFF